MKNEKKELQADILEIFSSIQGEGPFMGVKQIFVRFAKCNMKCGFCDLERPFPPKEFSSAKLMSIVKQIVQNSGDHHSISLTGGEPLLYKDFLKEFLTMLRETGLKVYFETNATLPGPLKELIDFLDIIAIDFKLPSSTGNSDCWKAHEESLKIAKKKSCFVKAVVTAKTKKQDIEKTINIISKVDKDILLVLQPVWPIKKAKQVEKKELFDYLFMAEKKLNNVRIMPQMHKTLGVK